MLLPATSRKLWDKLLDLQSELLSYSEQSLHNVLFKNPTFSRFGVITTGLGGNYYEENVDELSEKPSHLHIGTYPFPVEKIRALADGVHTIVVIEEGYPFVERYLRGILQQTVRVAGKLDGSLPISGELNPDNVRPAIGLESKQEKQQEEYTLPGRPPQLCAGCSHKDSYEALNKALEGYSERLVTGDIGCYTLGFLPPYKAIDTCLCMGGSVSMAKGAAEAGAHPVVGVVGDSTFLHSGISPLVDAVAGNVNMTLFILDNSTTAMTGGQETIFPSSKLAKLVEGIGVDPEHIKVMEPLKKNLEQNAEILRKEIEYPGVSVVISLRECIQTLKTKKRAAS
jgi:indolepyruvate ferredoxin oxidoreductase alpha subunit